jgi:hypothetical protein
MAQSMRSASSGSVVYPLIRSGAAAACLATATARSNCLPSVSACRGGSAHFCPGPNLSNVLLMIRDPYVAKAFKAAEDDGLAPSMATTDAQWRRCRARPRDGGGLSVRGDVRARREAKLRGHCFKERPYRSDRNEGWMKIKAVQKGQFPVIGFVKDPTGVAALYLGKREGKDLVFMGKVGPAGLGQSQARSGNSSIPW